MYPQTLYPKTKQVLDKLKNLKIPGDWYLAGGTALALQLGHRKSIDLDLFTDNFPKRDILVSALKHLSPTIIQEAQGTLDTNIDSVKLSFLEYKYPMIEEFADFDGFKLASIIDIACMKITAISSRGSKKDFFDIYFILKSYPLGKIMDVFPKKYQGVNYQISHILKSLSYFEDAEKDPDPDMTNDTSWQQIKTAIEKEVENFYKSIIS